MNSIELYINNTLVDVTTGEEVSLELYSPIFKDLSELGENYTYSISIPATPNNNAILGFANRADVFALSSVTNLTASLYVDGVPIIENGNATVLDISPEAYDITITWGGLEALREVWNKNIGEIYTPNDPSEAHVYWRVSGTTGLSPNGSVPAEGYGYWRYFAEEGYEGNLRFNRKAMLPMVSTNYLLSLITRATGVTFDTTNIGEYLIPLTTLNGSEYATLNGPNGAGNSTLINASITFNADGYTSTAGATFSASSLPDLSTPIVDRDPDDIIEEDRLRATDGVLNILPTTITISTPAGLRLQSAAFMIESYDANDILLTTQTITGVISGADASFAISYASTHPNLAYIKMRASLTFGVPPTQGEQLPLTVGFLLNAYATYWVMPGRYYPILANLPQLTCGQLIDSLCQLSGVYAIATNNNVSFLSRAEAVDDTFIRDMSSKYRSQYSDPALVSANYIAEDYGQSNKFVYEEGIAVASGDGSFIINNPLLPREVTVVEVPFTPTDTLAGQLHLPLWDYEGKWQGFDGIPIVSVATTTFDDSLKFSKILISNNYLGWVQLMQQYRETRFLMKLSPLDIAQLKWEYAWQIDALGAAYKPIRINYSTDGICEVSAIKIV